MINTPMTLRQFDEYLAGDTCYLWFLAWGEDEGEEYLHRPDAQGEDACDIVDVLDDLDWWGLVGDVCMTAGHPAYLTWTWNGEGCPVDNRGKSVKAIRVS